MKRLHVDFIDLKSIYSNIVSDVVNNLRITIFSLLFIKSLKFLISRYEFSTTKKFL
jgi:hypothetical protein